MTTVPKTRVLDAPVPDAPIDVVTLSGMFDLKKLFDNRLEDRIRLLHPDEVTDPASVEYAFAWVPDPDAFTAFPNLKLVSSIAAGVDNILACPSLPNDIVVTRIRDDHQARLMAEFAAFQVIWHHRRMGAFVDAQRRHAWERGFYAKPFETVTVGILGFGLMGRACARLIAAMGFNVLVARNSGSEDSGIDGVTVKVGPDAVMDVARQADILVNVLPLTDATRDFMTLDFFRQMPKGAALVQIGRGEQMVEDDLITALDEGHLSGASVDVLRKEPPAPDHPFFARSDIMLTPHKASDPSRAEALRQLAENILSHRDGNDVPGAVNKSAGY